MQFNSAFARLAATATLAASAATASEATFVQFVVVTTQVTTGGVLLDQHQVFARFNGPTDTVLNVFNLRALPTNTDATHNAFYHKDNSSYNGGVLSRQYGTWSPTLTGSPTLNRPFDSYLVIGGAATATNTTSPDPSWNSGGCGPGSADGRGWNRPDLPNNGTNGWFNGSPPNLQGRVGVSPNTATDVLLGQFITDRGASAGTFQLTLGYNDGVPGTAVQFATATFTLGGGSASGTIVYRDADGDGFGVTACPYRTAFALSGYVANNTDCDDTNASIFPRTWSRDLDGDGFGFPGDGTLVQCAQPSGYVLNGTDNCPTIANPSQTDCNANGIGDVCEALAGNSAIGWGSNSDGQINPPASLTNAVQIAAGGYHGLARQSNGSIVGWGKNQYGQLNLPSGLGAVIDIAAGIEHSVAVKADGTVAAWGLNNYGQCSVVPGLTGVVQVSAGFTHTAARKTDGTVVCWGGGTTNTGTDPNFGQSIVPAGLTTVTDLATGAYHTIARRSNGTLAIWGFNAYGQLNAPAGQTFRRAVGGVFHTVGIRTDGLVMCWGENQYGQCTVPTDLGPVSAVAAGYASSYAIKLDGRVVAWGLNDVGQRNVPATLVSANAIAAGYGFALAQRPISLDCNANGTPDSCEISSGAGRDCNGNGALDSCELAAGTLFDCDADGVPDACEGGVPVNRVSGTLAPVGGTNLSFTFAGLPASRGNGVRLTIDALGDLESTNETLGLTFDGGPIEFFFVNGATNCTVGPNRAVRNFTNAQFNALVADGTLLVGILPSATVSATECPDSFVRLTLEYTALGSGSDCNNNGLLDSCEIGNGLIADCNANSILDTCELASGAETDCNGNGQLDSCELAAGTSTDLNNNGRLDECPGEFVVGGSGYATIAEAIAAAPSGSQIDVSPGTYTGAISITTKSVKLKSIAGATQTILSGTGLDASIITVRSAASNGTIIDGFTLRDGPVGTAEFGTRLGGAIVCIQTNTVIRNCRFLNNSSAYGGAIYGYDLSGSIDHCLFESNHGTVGPGAVQVGFGGTVDLAFNEYLNNTAGQDGGAVAVVQWFEGPVTTATIRNSVFRGNSAVRYGGALTWYAGLGTDLAISNCTVESNSSSGPVFARVPESTSATLRFAFQGTRFCLNNGGNVEGPVLNQGGNTFSQDCNANGLCDADEIAAGTQQDCNGNGLPDSCDVGRVFAWGENNFGQTVVPSSLGRTRDISAGCNHVLAIDEDRKVVAWGSNTFGQRTVPSNVTAALAVASGCDHSLALRTDGTVAAWGYNAYGQTNVPSAANGDVAQIAAGANHSGVRKTNGSLVLWGRNADGECNVPSGLGSASKLALGGAHSIALRSDGTLLCWGLNNFGQCTIPAIGGAVVDIAAGCYHSVALRSDGTVRAWGSNIFGQTNVPAGLSNVIKVASGSGQHTLALKANGSVVSWGWNSFGQTTVPAAVNAISQISAGGTFSIGAAPGSLDCNGNGIVDSCEIASGAALDCNLNGTPDACELVDGVATDCNNNSILDSCELASGAESDCNGNTLPDSCDLAAGTSTDLNGNGRPDECSGEWIVGGSGFATIQAAIAAAPSGTVIRVGPGTFSGPISIDTKQIELRSIGGPGSTTISGSGLSTSILTIRSAAANGTVIEGITFRDGPIGTAEFGFRLGGAIYCIQTSATIRDCRFYGNSSEYGGAIYALNLTGTISNCLFDGNHSIMDAGAVQVGYGGDTVLSGNTFRNNIAGRNGGALQVVQGDTPPLSSSSIVNCVFTSNTAAVSGGAISWYVGLGGNLPITGCVIESNTATTAAVARVAGSSSMTARFVVANTRLCLNTGGNISGPLEDQGGNTFSQDCNGNGICDADEIAGGTVPDCDSNGFPDSCQLGKAIAWGENTNGQATPPASLGSPREVSAGCAHAVAIKSDRSVIAWGSNSFGQTSVPAGLTSATLIAAGCDHNVALRSDGTLFAWGYNAFGQCDIPSTASGNVVQVAAGANHSGVRKADGSLVLWGRNANAELAIPSALGAATHLALGGAHSVALRADGRPFCWGLDNFGQCNVPAAALNLKDITAGCYHTVGVRPDGTVRAWGSNIFGQTDVPAGLTDVVMVAAGSGQHTLALLGDGSVIAWGWNNFGQSTVPSAADTTIGGISAGGTFSIVRTSTPFDCNGNGAIDSCELASGSATDCNGNGTIDSCEIVSGATPDCNGNGVPDSCDIAAGTALDCNTNGVPDSCDLASGSASDCNGNGKPDSCDIASGFSADCNSNARPDSCDIALGSSTDLNGNGRPDECSGEWVVGGSGYASIQAAINAAPNGSVIRVAPGTWTPISITGKSLTLESFQGAATTFISGGGTQRAVAMQDISALGVKLTGFTIRNGLATDGGGIRLVNASPWFVDCVISANTASGNGGGMYCASGAPLFEGCRFIDNIAVQGGGAYLTGAPSGGGFAQFDFCVFNSNDSSGTGAGVYNASPLLLTDCDVLSNTAGTGAGGLFTAAGGASSLSLSYFCLNLPVNVVGAYSDLGGNILGEDCNENGICDLDELAGGAEDSNGNQRLDECELARGDLNLDGVVSAADISALLNFWGATNPPFGDLNGDGVINGADISVLLNNWGT